MKINYPIKYAAMPIIEQVGWSNGFHEQERKYDIVCYIVSKCYLISDLTKYNEDGSSLKEYEVVFPYQLINDSKWQRCIPTFNLINANCTNSNKVDMLFDSYEEALNYVSFKNEKLCESTWINIPYSKDMLEKIHSKRDEFYEKLTRFRVLEEQIQLNTEDMQIGKNKKLNNVIEFENNSGRILPCSIYEILSLYEKERFVVCTISYEQYDKLKSIINGIDLVIKNKQSFFKEIKNVFFKLVFEGNCFIQSNSINSGFKLEKIGREILENIDDETIIFYTTETMEDLFNSYKTHSIIDLKDLQGSKLKRK